MHPAGKLDGLSLVLTPLYVVVSLLLAATPEVVGASGVWPRLLGVFLLVVGSIGLAAMPRSYAVEDDTLTVRTVLGGTQIPLSAVRSARVIERSEKPYLRMFGTRGVFGSFGLFRTGAGETAMVQATRLFPMVRVERKGKRPLYLSAEKPEALVAALENPSSPT